MRFNIHLRSEFRQQVKHLAENMKSWEKSPRIEQHEEMMLLEAITPFEHTTKCSNLLIGGVDGSGDFPSLSYADTFIYVAIAQGAVYTADPTSGLREVRVVDPLVGLAWIVEEENARRKAYDEIFERFSGMTLAEVIERSDFSIIKSGGPKKKGNCSRLLA